MNKALHIYAACAMAFAGAAWATGAQAKSPLLKAPQFSAKDCDMLSAGSARSACMRSIAGGEPGVDSAAAARATGSGTYWHAPSRTAGVTPPDVSSAPNTGVVAAAVGVTSNAAAEAEVGSSK